MCRTIASNHITSLPVDLFQTTTSLVNMYVRMSGDCHWIADLTCCSEMGRNHITMLPAGIFAKLSNLQTLYVDVQLLFAE